MDSDLPSESKPRLPDPLSALDDSTVPNGCIIRRPTPRDDEEVADDCDSDRVGVLDYMPLSRHATSEVACHRLRPSASPAESFDVATPVSRPVEPKNIELTTFRITECHDRRGPVTCSSCASDDELLGAESEDFLHEVIVVQSSGDVPVDRPERSGPAISGVGDLEPTPSILRCIPSSCGAARDGAWSRPESHPVDEVRSVDRDLEEDTFTTTFRGSVEREGGCVAMTTAEDERDEEALEDRSPDHESSPKDLSSPDTLEPSKTLPPPVEVVSVDHRSAMDPSSLSRSNVLYLNDYSLWTNAARAFCRDEAASSDRSEVEKRQERRDKRRERRGNERTVKAEEIEGYMGMRELKDLVEYIQGEDGAVEKRGGAVAVVVVTGKREKRKSETSGATSLVGESVGKSAEVPQRAIKQKSKTTSVKLAEIGDVVKGVEVGVGTATMTLEEGAEGGSMLDERESSDLPEVGSSELDTGENLASKDPGKTSTSKDPGKASASEDPGKTSVQLDTLELDESVQESSSDCPTPKSAEKTEQILGHASKKSKKSNSKKNRGAEITEKTQQGSRANMEIATLNPQRHDNSSETFPGAYESGALSADGSDGVTLSEGELSVDSALGLHRHPHKSSESYTQGGEDDEWTVHHTRRHPKHRTKQDDAEIPRPSNEQYYSTVWKDPMGKPGFRRPEGRGGFGKVGIDGFQRFANPSGGRGGRQGSTSGVSAESSGKVGSRTFWGSRESRDARENPRVFDTPGNSGKFPNQRSCVEEVESRKEESVTYARIAAGDPVWPPIGPSGEAAGVEKATTSGETSSGVKEEVSGQMGVEEVIHPLEMMPGNTVVTVQSDVAGTSGDPPLKLTAETGTVVLTSKEQQPRRDTTTVSTPTKQSDATSSGEGLAPLSKNLPRNIVSDNTSGSNEVEHSTGRRSSEANAVETGNTESHESTSNTTEAKHGAVSNDGDPTVAGQTLPKVQPKRNPKALPVEFSRRFKGANVDGISFCFDPTVSTTDSRSQGSSSTFSDRSSTLESSSSSGGSVSARLVSSGPTYSTTVVPAGGGLQSQSSGTSVSNCSRPIAPLSGSGHASGAKTPVVVVNPMQVARGPAEPPQTIVTSDVDPEILKEVVVAAGAVRIDAAVTVATAPRIVVGSSSSVFPSKVDDGGAGGKRVDMTRPPNETDVIQLKESPVFTGADGCNPDLGKHMEETSGLSSIPRPQQCDPRPKHLDPQLDTPQFLPPFVYAYVSCPQPALRGMAPTPSNAAPGPDTPQGLCQPRSREMGPCALTLPRLPVASLVLIQSYIHNEFQKVLDEEKHAPAKVVRYKDDSPNVA